MKTLSLFILSVLLLSCSSHKKAHSVSGKKVQQEVNTFLNAWHQDAAEADFKAYFDKMADNAYYFGTDSSEIWTKADFEAFSKPFFDKGRAWDFKPTNRLVQAGPNGQVIWFYESLNTWMGVCRGSGVVRRNPENGQYLIEQYVLSLAVPNDKMRDVIELIEE